ncbi:unnamed protein product [Strongylus vulgaris]|uniref:G domain-containing protein n=1 Tax=Strongylus vulgaris TaxID=40348 RepID=A0A3P7JXE2_STRVU|nr:unnamed protein product [Strongylus vulgaris]
MNLKYCDYENKACGRSCSKSWRNDKAAEETRHAAMVAVVGYTNAGKTSLVKCLTGASSLLPKDRLFATLIRHGETSIWKKIGPH